MQPIDIERARAAIVEAIGGEVELKRVGRGQMVGCCPFHGPERTPSFYVYLDNPHWHCFGCGAHGDAIGFVQRRRGLDFPAAVRWLLDMPADQKREKYNPKYNPTPPRETDAETAARVAAILAECGPVVEGTPAWLYCWSRGLRPTPTLLAHPGLYCHEVRAPLPALVAPLIGSDGVANSLQRIWVADMVEYDGSNPQKDARAPLVTRKKCLGAMGDASVQLAPAGGILGLCEGVESSLAAMQLYRLPTWATCGAARLGSIAIPADVRQVIIFGDRGPVGEAAAAKAALIYSERGLSSSVVLPTPDYQDFNDQVRGIRL